MRKNIQNEIRCNGIDLPMFPFTSVPVGKYTPEFAVLMLDCDIGDYGWNYSWDWNRYVFVEQLVSFGGSGICYCLLGLKR